MVRRNSLLGCHDVSCARNELSDTFETPTNHGSAVQVEEGPTPPDVGRRDHHDVIHNVPLVLPKPSRPL
jgi:hypothetical protein